MTLLLIVFIAGGLLLAWAMARVSADTDPVREDAGEYDE